MNTVDPLKIAGMLSVVHDGIYEYSEHKSSKYASVFKSKSGELLHNKVHDLFLPFEVIYKHTDNLFIISRKIHNYSDYRLIVYDVKNNTYMYEGRGLGKYYEGMQIFCVEQGVYSVLDENGKVTKTIRTPLLTTVLENCMFYKDKFNVYLYTKGLEKLRIYRDCNTWYDPVNKEYCLRKRRTYKVYVMKEDGCGWRTGRFEKRNRK